ncbi:hypothetical protein HYFRA_00011118 [Hymenoscyphus fraxineus]|uniref:Uncharacterized protein n=1 Tax=Hymenoscyphus fraxineus TaxID=746836 RepID=A0A9N9L4I7_9HELO|nr:hypothetical protein HYFRA_00011118 [Hymenoscyphus fraxineus]
MSESRGPRSDLSRRLTSFDGPCHVIGLVPVTLGLCCIPMPIAETVGCRDQRLEEMGRGTFIATAELRVLTHFLLNDRDNVNNKKTPSLLDAIHIQLRRFPGDKTDCCVAIRLTSSSESQVPWKRHDEYN